MISTAHGAGRIARLGTRLAGVVAAAGILLAMTALPASAHATLLFTSPADDSAVPASPTVITLPFNESVSLTGTPVTLAGPGGHPAGLAAPRLSQGHSVLTVRVRAPLPPNHYPAQRPRSASAAG